MFIIQITQLILDVKKSAKCWFQKIGLLAKNLLHE